MHRRHLAKVVTLVLMCVCVYLSVLTCINFAELSHQTYANGTTTVSLKKRGNRLCHTHAFWCQVFKAHIKWKSMKILSFSVKIVRIYQGSSYIGLTNNNVLCILHKNCSIEGLNTAFNAAAFIHSIVVLLLLFLVTLSFSLVSTHKTMQRHISHCMYECFFNNLLHIQANWLFEGHFCGKLANMMSFLGVKLSASHSRTRNWS